MLIQPVASAGRMRVFCLARSPCHDCSRRCARPPDGLGHGDRRSPSTSGAVPFPGAILLIATPAVICGADSWTEVEYFGCRKQAWPVTFLDLPHGIPSHDAFGRVFSLLDPEQPEPALQRGGSCWPQRCRTGSRPWTARQSRARMTTTGSAAPALGRHQAGRGAAGAGGREVQRALGHPGTA